MRELQECAQAAFVTGLEKIETEFQAEASRVFAISRGDDSRRTTAVDRAAESAESLYIAFGEELVYQVVTSYQLLESFSKESIFAPIGRREERAALQGAWERGLQKAARAAPPDGKAEPGQDLVASLLDVEAEISRLLAEVRELLCRFRERQSTEMLAGLKSEIQRTILEGYKTVSTGSLNSDSLDLLLGRCEAQAREMSRLRAQVSEAFEASGASGASRASEVSGISAVRGARGAAEAAL